MQEHNSSQGPGISRLLFNDWSASNAAREDSECNEQIHALFYVADARGRNGDQFQKRKEAPCQWNLPSEEKN